MEQTPLMDKKYTNIVRIRRIESLYYLTSQLVRINLLNGEEFTLNPSIVAELSEHYVQDLINIKTRYCIKDRVNLAKVAGLMAYSIMKHRPWIPMNGNLDVTDDEGNETIAIYHAIVLCSEHIEENFRSAELKRFFHQPQFEEWLRNYKFLLRRRDYNGESLFIIFQSIVNFFFTNANNLTTGD